MSEVTAGELESLGLKADEAAHLSARWHTWARGHSPGCVFTT